MGAAESFFPHDEEPCKEGEALGSPALWGSKISRLEVCLLLPTAAPLQCSFSLLLSE